MAKVITLTCPECGEPFARKHHRQLFCSPAHSKAYSNRQLARGQSVVALLQVWQASRTSKDPAAREAGRVAFAQLCREARTFNAEDREAGRADPVKLFRIRMAEGHLD